VQAWVSEAEHPSGYTWSATGGRLEGQGREATWNFEGVQPGRYTATVAISGVKAASSTCSAEVIVLEHQGGRGLERLTGRSLLVDDGPEAQGYGLYSYLLFTAPQDDASRERCKKMIEAYLNLIPDVVELEKYLKPNELNDTYVPVDAEPPKLVSADWILQHYNYARALVLLRSVPGTHRDGPYILSSLKPVDGKTLLTENYLFQDLSSVPPNLAASWVNAFMNQAAQERFWEPESAERVVLKLRTAIGILAVGLPQVQGALGELIAWRKSVVGS